MNKNFNLKVSGSLALIQKVRLSSRALRPGIGLSSLTMEPLGGHFFQWKMSYLPYKIIDLAPLSHITVDNLWLLHQRQQLYLAFGCSEAIYSFKPCKASSKEFLIGYMFLNLQLFITT